MLKVLKIIGLFLLALVAVLLITGLLLHRPLPTGQPGPEADALARRMESALGKAAWDTTRFVRWTFPGNHHYLWDRSRDMVEVRWAEFRVLLHTPTENGLAFQNDQLLSGSDAAKAIQSAWSFFANDSFWLIAPFKAFDPGTTRELVPQPDGSAALLVRYSSGGVTPGDAYLWLLDKEARPKAWRLWVKILPIGGMQTSWEDWQQMPQGAWLASRHEFPRGLYTVQLTDIATTQALAEWGVAEDPFGALERRSEE